MDWGREVDQKVLQEALLTSTTELTRGYQRYIDFG
jgi:hypothetical protein